ncbi:Ger(x)C family spore germination protein [Robertmurraya korlensis]|uniref:Ger(x)C family spore germination protein n=1 Tax=Robertmurraya korlensis TaxID=519977 RepID=UPI00203B32D2|nr:Ger(x)C family spore germination protein [Robertmurraya korlensis]MCM3601006.1 Ger(x)C family spore germination protein [Robertmurraya korlensis]
MNKNNLCRRFVGIFFICIFISGCSRTTIIDDVKIIQSLGYDLENNKIKGTASYPVYVESMQESHPRKLFTSESNTTTGVYTSFSNQTAHRIDMSQLGSVFFSENFAKNGISDLIGNLNSDPNISSNSTLIISSKSASDLLEESMNYPPYFLSSVLDQSMRNGNIPLSNLHTVSYQYYSEGQDMYIPKMDINEKGLFVSEGVGVFKDEKLALSLNNKESLMLKILVDKLGFNSTYEFTTSDNKQLLIKIVSNNKNSHVQINNSEVTYKFKLKVYLKEQASKLSVANINNKLTKEIETNIRTELTNLLEKLKKENVDPVGVGELFRGAQRDWKRYEFYERVYPNIKFNIKANVNIVNTGAAK